jgi:tetratricopeptide (TPR) repeat protein
MAVSSNANTIEKLLNFWVLDKENLAISADILSKYAAEGNVAEAKEFISQLSSNLQINPKLQWLYAKSYVTNGDFTKALSIFESLPEDQAFSRAYGVSICLFFKKEFHKASSLIKNTMVLSDKPLAPEFILLLAKVEYHLGLIDIAIDYAEQLLSTNYAKNPELLGLLAMLKLDKNDIQQSNRYADECLGVASEQHDGLLAKASCLVYTQDAKSAERYAQIGVNKFPNSGRFWSVLSQVQMLNQMMSESYSSICKAVELMPEHIGSWHIKGWLELTTERLSNAFDSFKSALSIDRNFADSHGGLAVVAFHQGDYAAAENQAKIALRLDPNSFSGRYALSLLSKNNGDLISSKRIVDDILNQESHIQGTNYSQLIQLLSK